MKFIKILASRSTPISWTTSMKKLSRTWNTWTLEWPMSTTTLWNFISRKCSNYNISTLTRQKSQETHLLKVANHSREEIIWVFLPCNTLTLRKREESRILAENGTSRWMRWEQSDSSWRAWYTLRSVPIFLWSQLQKLMLLQFCRIQISENCRNGFRKCQKYGSLVSSRGKICNLRRAIEMIWLTNNIITIE